MACYKPLKAYSVNRLYKDGTYGKREIVWHENAIRGQDKATSIEIPCGQCVGCRLDYSRQWANRCMLEAKDHENNSFITLTYNDANIPLKEIVDTKTGEVKPISSLNPEHTKNFIKKLRRHYKYHYNHEGIRYYLCGEYGDKTKRAHYHVLLYNCEIKDKVFHKRTEAGILWTSETLAKIWGKGHIIVADMTWETCAYTARYMMKKQKGKDAKSYYENLGIIPEFCRMSLKPGIGLKYYEENKDKIYENDEIWITGSKGKATKIKPPNYYDKLYDLEEPEKMEEIKEAREYAAYIAKMNKWKKINIPMEEQLKIEERAKGETIKALVRPLE